MFFALLLLFTHPYLLLQTFEGIVSICCYYINICHRYRVSMATRSIQTWLTSVAHVWDGKSLHLPIQVSLRAARKEIYRKYHDTDHTEISFGGQFQLEPHPNWPPWKVSFSFSDEQPRHFYVGVPCRGFNMELLLPLVSYLK